MTHPDHDAGQQDGQDTLDQGTPQPSSLEEERSDDHTHGNQSALFEEKSEQEMVGMVVPEPHLPDEMQDHPEGQDELIDPVGEEVDQETADTLPGDHPEKEVVPITLEGAQ